MRNIGILALPTAPASVCLFVPGVRAQVGAQAPIAVHLDVTADDALQQRVTSCLTEELKTDPGIALNDGAAALTLSVIVVEQKMSDGQMIGYLVYAGGYQPGPQCTGDATPDPSGRPVVVYWQTLRMLPPDLKKACQRIVTDFKTEVVEPTRASQRELESRPGPR
jgi:hypothetical protein